MSARQDLKHVAYVSTMTQHMSTADLLRLLQRAREENEARDITGLLLHKENCFFQVLEGTQEAIEQAFERIIADPRHTQLEVLLDEPAQSREYPDWRMGFVNLDSVDPSLLKGYSPYLEPNENPRAFLAALGRGEQLARVFKDLA